jgi:hypothetical protein
MNEDSEGEELVPCFRGALYFGKFTIPVFEVSKNRARR